MFVYFWQPPSQEAKNTSDFTCRMKRESFFMKVFENGKNTESPGRCERLGFFLSLTLAAATLHCSVCAKVKQLQATTLAQLHFSEFIDFFFCTLQSVDIMVKQCKLVAQPSIHFALKITSSLRLQRRHQIRKTSSISQLKYMANLQITNMMTYKINSLNHSFG